MPTRIYSADEKRVINDLTREKKTPREIAAELVELGYDRTSRQVSGWLSEQRKKNEERPWLIFGDTHAPYQHRNTLAFLSHVMSKYNCREDVYHDGDMFDFHAMSRHTTEPGAHGPEYEYEKALRFVEDLHHLFPHGTLVLGNHDRIPQRQMKVVGLSDMLLKDLNSLYGLPPTWTIEKLYAVIPETDTLIEHGIGSTGKNGAINTALVKESNYVQGHAHNYAGVAYSANHKGKRWGMNTGCLLDSSSNAAKYAKHAIKKGVLGCGLVYPAVDGIDEKAVFIPMGEFED